MLLGIERPYFIGIPHEIVSDQGPNFMSKLLAQLYDQLGVFTESLFLTFQRELLF